MLRPNPCAGVRRRVPRRQTIAALTAAVVAACGLTYTGLHRPESAPQSASPHPSVRSAPLTEAEAATKASSAGHPVEVSALRTAYSPTWARPDGMMVRHVHATPIRAKVSGQWKPINTDLARTMDGWSPKATNVRMTFSPGSRQTSERAGRSGAIQRMPLLALADDTTSSDSALVTLATGGHEVDLTWPGPVPTPIIDGPRALYPEILPGVDLVLTADDGGFAQLVVVKTREASANPQVAQLAYGLSSPDLDFTLDPTTGIISAADTDGQEVAVSPTPLMWDSSGTPTLTDGQAGSSASPTAPEVLLPDRANQQQDDLAQRPGDDSRQQNRQQKLCARRGGASAGRRPLTPELGPT